MTYNKSFHKDAQTYALLEQLRLNKTFSSYA